MMLLMLQPVTSSSDPQFSDSIGQRLAGEDSDSNGPLVDNSSSAGLDMSLASNIDQSTFGPEQSILSVCEDRNSLNEGFICPEDDDALQADSTTLSSVCSDGAINVTQFPGEPVRSCYSDSSVNCSGVDTSADQSNVFDGSQNVSKRTKMLRRGRPNSLKAGLLSGEPRKVQNLRRSFGLDKSDISGPIPLYVPDVSDMETSSSDKPPEKEGVPSNQEGMKNVQTEEASMNVSMKKSLSLKDLQTTEVNTSTNEKREGEQSSDKPVPKIQACDSTDSLLSGQQSPGAPPDAKKQAMQRSLSTDSGKGSMFDESGVVDANSSQDTEQFLDGNLGMDIIEGILGAEPSTGKAEEKSENEIRKSLSSTNLAMMQKSRSSISRSHSVYHGASKRQPNITPNLQISTETQNLLSRAGYLSMKGMKKTSDDDFQVMGPPPPRIKHAEFHKPKRESILELKLKHAGRVAASIQQFEKGSITSVAEKLESADIVERHNSPLRFPNCVSRRAGASPLKMPSMLTRNESLANKRYDCHPSKIFSKGQARLPISTQLLKPTEQVTVTKENPSPSESKCRKPTRRPSIYYAKDVDPPRKDSNTLQDTTINDSVFETAVATPLPEEMMETCEDDIDQELYKKESISSALQNEQDSLDKENLSTSESIKMEESNVCLSETLTRTPSKPDSVMENSNTPKLPKILQPLGDSVILRTPGGLTPKQVLQRSHTTCSPRSPVKAVKRLGSSPGSPGHHFGRRHSMSPRRSQHKISLPASVPRYLQDEMNGM